MRGHGYLTESTVRVRQAMMEDCTGIARVQVDSYRTAYAGILPTEYLSHFTYEEQAQDWRDLLASEQQDVLYIAEAATGEIVGYALGRAGDSEIPPYDSELVALHVHRSHQRQGVGQPLMAAVAKALQQQGCSSMMLWVLAENPSRSFYERLGGRLIGERVIELGEDVKATEVAYGWPAIASLALPGGSQDRDRS